MHVTRVQPTSGCGLQPGLASLVYKLIGTITHKRIILAQFPAQDFKFAPEVEQGWDFPHTNFGRDPLLLVATVHAVRKSRFWPTTQVSDTLLYAP